ncbi:hypothetical protein F8562_13630 [Klebsiella sp. RCJ4]|uniref:hypothetical protein n=1 Tax=Klebsiella sp. RCJ4 TaxID=2652158 RepID=UPI00125DAE98|nr:hypothetical protein [Klebsiella sp. RCJ4]EGF0273849.1 hypothetical protein [Salmonella enterica]EHP6630093.1 hypothetical protein [Salmonella enterica]EJR9172541.1 hypothetical protein [Salmonella enterica]EKA2737461.1 hypothetical protein [Salmonella enterica]KAB5492772.1 hypothetical protein F8562_13630 [Klebsiella sp. RCJ4]
MHKINYTDDIDLSKISRRGSFNKNKIPSEAVRSYCVSVRLNVEELQLLNIKRGSYKKGEWLRMASLQKLPPVIPTINTKAWKALTDISQKLNRIAIHIDGKSKDSQLTHTELFAVKRQLEELRHNLLRTDFWSIPREGYAEDQEG